MSVIDQSISLTPEQYAEMPPLGLAPALLAKSPSGRFHVRLSRDGLAAVEHYLNCAPLESEAAAALLRKVERALERAA